jgi:hypothetical protein
MLAGLDGLARPSATGMSFPFGLPVADASKELQPANRPDLAMHRLSQPEEGQQADYRDVQAVATHLTHRR